MSLKKRVIPCLDVRDGRVVKGVEFQALRDVGDPAELARLYSEQEADEVVLLDVSASLEGRRTLLRTVQRAAEQLFVPLTVGGGVGAVDDVRLVLRAGADKVAMNTAAVLRPELVREASEVFGRQCIVASVDARSKGEGGWEVFTHGGSRATGLDALDWCERLAELGAGEILLTSMDRDGTRDGYDLALTRAVVDRVDVPVIASGGAGTVDHLAEVLLEAGADAALAASIFHEGDATVRRVKADLIARGVPLRPPLEAPA